MKRYIVVILVLCLSGIPSMLGVLKANEHVTKEEDGREYRWHRHKPTYFVGRNGVFFDGRPIKDASPSSFRILGDGYAVDNWHVYYRGNVMAEAALSLEVLGYGYVKDAWNVFYDGRKLKEPQPGRSLLFQTGMPRITGVCFLMARRSMEPPLEVLRCFVTDMRKTIGRCIMTVSKLRMPVRTLFHVAEEDMPKIIGAHFIVAKSLTDVYGVRII